MSEIAQELIDQLEADPSIKRIFVNNPADPAQASKVTDPRAREMAEAYFAESNRLQGDKIPNNTRLVEKPLHRMMVYLHASGLTAKEIAAQMDTTYASVSQVLRQPWARQKLVETLDELGKDKVRSFLDRNVAPSLEVLESVRDDAKAKASDRMAAANALLDRALGKPTVHVEATNTNRNIPSDIVRLDAELAAVRERLASKGAEPQAN